MDQLLEEANAIVALTRILSKFDPDTAGRLIETVSGMLESVGSGDPLEDEPSNGKSARNGSEATTIDGGEKTSKETALDMLAEYEEVTPAMVADETGISGAAASSLLTSLVNAKKAKKIRRGTYAKRGR